MIINSSEGAALEVNIDPELLQKIQELSEESSTSLDTVVEVSLWKIIPELRRLISAQSSYGLAYKVSEADKINLLTE
ncbi:hypothetical protein H6G04_16815 [Calothrix membranacea FACHB-236]|nr:hypothetical protein [Calothrix membranacea FACHB-236]